MTGKLMYTHFQGREQASFLNMFVLHGFLCYQTNKINRGHKPAHSHFQFGILQPQI